MTSFGSRVTRTPRCAAAIASLAILASAGCATPAQRVDREASSLGYTRSLLQGRSFRHVVYANGRSSTATDRPMSIAGRFHRIPPRAIP
jgi:adenylylsulfate kinase-like enzyme